MIYVIGMGPGNANYVTAEAIHLIQQADKVLAFGRIAETAEQFRQPIIHIARVDEIPNHLNEREQIAILASGDPGFFGIIEYLKTRGILINNIVPGISSMQYMMAKLQKSWHHAIFFSLHGRDEHLEQIKKYPLTVILTDKNNTPRVISERLHELGLQGALYVGYHLSYENERILKQRIGDDIEDANSLAIVVVEHEMDSRQ